VVDREMRPVLLQTLTGIAAALLGAHNAAAEPLGAGSQAAQWQRGGVAFEASLGVMNGEANEYVYNPDGSTLSRLTWTFDSVVVLNAGLALSPLPWLTLGARGRINVAEYSTMDDYDYGIAGCPGLLCHSHHERTDLTHFTSFDAYAAATVLEQRYVSLKLLAGYKRDGQSWQAYGGTANYGVLPPGLVISYEQHWRAPYVGVSVDSRWERWSMGARIVGSWWARGEGLDNHHLRGLLFADTFGRSRMIGANAHVGYLIAANVTLKADYDMQRWDVGKGSTVVTDYVRGPTYTIPGEAAGGDSESHTVSVGLNVSY
jgi:plasminogen activator